MGDWIVEFINFLIGSLAAVLNFLINLLPDSPFDSISNSPISEYLGWLNWILPISQIIVILELWGSAIVVYYLYQIALRWVKAIE